MESYKSQFSECNIPIIPGNGLSAWRKMRNAFDIAADAS